MSYIHLVTGKVGHDNGIYQTAALCMRTRWVGDPPGLLAYIHTAG
jgi:hypothetical protein